MKWKIVMALLIILVVAMFLHTEVKFEIFYPKVVTLNNDGINDRLFFKYRNDEGKELFIRIYDITSLLLSEQKMSGSVKEFSLGEFFIYPFDFEDEVHSVLLPGVYIFVLTTKERIIGKGSFIVVK
ncbi:MAG: hypothetical protein N2Z73_02945 [Endomicrobia bacterium]|nr:hypothetical protein [Endomicrobiia bacterium]